MQNSETVYTEQGFEIVDRDPLEPPLDAAELSEVVQIPLDRSYDYYVFKDEDAQELILKATRKTS